MVKVYGNVIAHAGALSAPNGAHDTQAKGDAGIEIAECGGHVARLEVLASLRNGHKQAATGGIAGGVKALGVLHGASFSIAAHLAVYQARVTGMQCFVVVAQALQGRIAQACNEHVGLLQQLFYQFASSIRLHVDGKELLVGVAHVERRVVGAQLRHAEANAVAAVQVALDGFDLVHRGTHFAERAGAGGHRDVISQLDHYEPFKALRQFLGRQALEFFGGGHDDSVIQTHDNLLG